MANFSKLSAYPGKVFTLKPPEHHGYLMNLRVKHTSKLSLVTHHWIVGYGYSIKIIAKACLIAYKGSFSKFKVKTVVPLIIR